MPGRVLGGVDGGSGLPADFVARELQMYGSGAAQAVLVAPNLPEDAIVVPFGPKKFRYEETNREQIYAFDVMQSRGGRIVGARMTDGTRKDDKGPPARHDRQR